MNLSEVRKRAWETRRQTYGERGHSGSYQRSSSGCGDCRRMAYALVRLHVEGVLSEGQAAKMTGLDRIAVRRIADSIAAQNELSR